MMGDNTVSADDLGCPNRLADLGLFRDASLQMFRLHLRLVG